MLIQLQHQIESRTAQITTAHPGWPCHKGCADCCRNLASLPQLSEPEWHLFSAALHALPASVIQPILLRIAHPQQHPFVCPLLVPETNSCLIYHAARSPAAPTGFMLNAKRFSAAIASKPSPKPNPATLCGAITSPSNNNSSPNSAPLNLSTA